MRLLALVTARAGSTRLPGKNTRLLGGKPLVAWTIDAFAAASAESDLLVSTDDPLTAEICRTRGAMVPWLRPEDLATATATSVDVAIHALDWYENAHGGVDGLMLLQPTSPFRSRATIRRGIELFARAGQRAVIGMSPVRHSHPLLSWRVDGDGAVPFIPREGEVGRTQDVPPALYINGALYIATPHQIRTARTFVGERPVPLVIESPVEAIDIDDEFDFRVAEAMVTHELGSDAYQGAYKH